MTLAGKAPIVVEGATVLTLTQTEKDVFKVLLDTVEHYKLNTVLRVAGGWVRDKESHDIDVTLDNMLGKQFAEYVQSHLQETTHEQAKFAVIKSNPDQSKHLETATMKICGEAIDFVNLRSESYTADSRIPEMQMGTAEEDAFRRDLTINSLFYNINSASVEDYTHEGLKDLKEGIIRTPLDPMETFKDDPLRVLRAIRFQSRFGYKLDDGLQTAARSEQVQSALHDKISRERIGTELRGTLNSTRPLVGLQSIAHLQLADAVFHPPKSYDVHGPVAPEEFSPKTANLGLKNAFIISKLIQVWGLSPDVDMRRAVLLAAFLEPWTSATFKDRKGKILPVPYYILESSLKFPNNERDLVTLLLDNAQQFQDAVHVHKGFPDRLILGLLLKGAGPAWIYCTLIACLKDIAHLCPEVDEKWDPTAHAPVYQCINPYLKLRDLADKFQLDGVWKLKPILNGKEIVDLLNVPKGPAVGEKVQEVLEWQLRNPEGTKEECIEWLKKEGNSM